MLDGEVGVEGERSGGGYDVEGERRGGGIKGVIDGGVGGGRVGRDRSERVTFRSRRLGMFVKGLEALDHDCGLKVIFIRGRTFRDVGGRDMECLRCTEGVLGEGLVEDILNWTQWV